MLINIFRLNINFYINKILLYIKYKSLLKLKINFYPSMVNSTNLVLEFLVAPLDNQNTKLQPMQAQTMS